MTKQEKPDKPYDDYPLFPHDNGQWCKKIRKKLHYFGPWKDWEAAGQLYQAQREALYAGRDVTRKQQLTVADACNHYLVAKRSLLQSRDLAQRTYDDYKATCERILAEFGRHRSVESLTAADFDALRLSLSKRFGPVRLGNEITWTRSVFIYAYEASLIDKAVRFGPHFKRPSAKAVRLERARRGKRLFTDAELRAVLDSAQQPMHTIILLGINCGLGNSDIGRLELRHLDLNNRWLNFPRPKTGIDRRARLWPETVAGLRKVIEGREQKRDRKRKSPWIDPHPELVFLTKYGRPWHRGMVDNPVTREMEKLLKGAKLNRPGLNFYALRHTFQTVGEQSGDLVAVRAVMGHVANSNDMSAVYREEIADERIIRVCQHVRSWLFSADEQTQKVS